MDTPSICFFIMMFVCFILTFKIICDTERSETNIKDLEKEYDTLLERSIIVCDELAKAEELIITQNEIINELQEQILPDKVYLTIDPRTGIFYGCFYKKDRADKYTETSVDIVVREIEIIN